MPGLRGTIGPFPKGWSVSGGTITTPTVNGIAMKVHTFTATGSSTLTVNGPLGLVDTTEDYQAILPIDFLIVAGGGGAGSTLYAMGGTGGSGGVKTGTTFLTVGAYTIVVGAGGAGSSVSLANGTNGGDSSAFGITSNGGGGGGFGTSGGTAGNGSAGGSGGGGGGTGGGPTTGGSATSATPAQGSAGQGTSNGYPGAGGTIAHAAGIDFPALSLTTLYGGYVSGISGTQTLYAPNTGGNGAASPTYYGQGGAGVAGAGLFTGNTGYQGIVIITYRV